MMSSGTESIEENGELHWLAYRYSERKRGRDFAQALNIAENPPRRQFLEQLQRDSVVIEIESGARYAFRQFENTWDISKGVEGEPKVPVLYFLPWGITTDSLHGAYGIYSLVQALEPGRKVVVADIPGYGEAGPAEWQWQQDLTYSQIGQELLEAMDIYSYKTTTPLEIVHVSGNSNGGNVAAALAAALQERALSLTLRSTPGSEKRNLLGFNFAFANTENGRAKAKLANCEPTIRKAIEAIEATETNSQGGDIRTKAMLFLRFPWLMARAKLLDSLAKLSPETVVTIFCGTDEAVVSWDAELEEARELKRINPQSSIYLVAGGQHADLAIERYFVGAEIAAAVKRIEGSTRAVKPKQRLFAFGQVVRGFVDYKFKPVTSDDAARGKINK